LQFLKVVLIKEVVDFFVVFVSVYDDVCFTLSALATIVFSFSSLLFIFLGYEFVFGHYVVVIVGRADLFQFLGCQVPKWSLHLTVQHSYSLFCFHY